MRRHGVEIVGFHHGNDMGGQPLPGGDIVDLLAVGRFVVPSEASLRWRREYERSQLRSIHPVRFEKTALPQYRQWLEAARQTKLPQKIKTVMIVGFPPNWIDIRIGRRIGRLRSSTSRWRLSSARPRRLQGPLQGASGIRAGNAGTVQRHGLLLRGRSISRDCWQLADAFVFPRISSTSFGFAVVHQPPVVLLDVDSQNWLEDAYALLARRCRMVPARVDDGLRIHFDEKSLIDALRAPVSAPDESYVVEAMCS